MKTFQKGQDILRQVLTVKNLNEVSEAVRSVAVMRDRTGAGYDDQNVAAVRCHCATIVRAGDPVFPTAFAESTVPLTPRDSLLRPLAVRKATSDDLPNGLWGIALESADATVSFRAVFHGMAAVRLPNVGSGDYLAPDDSGSLVRTGTASRCRVLWTQDVGETDGDDESFSVAMVRLEDVVRFPAPLQWGLSVETIPAGEEGGGPTYRVRCAGGSVVVTDLAVATAVSVGDESASSADGTDDSQGGGGHSHGDGHAHDAGGGGPSNESITVPGITYGV